MHASGKAGRRPWLNNDVVAEYAVKTLAALSAKPEVWAVGERVHARLTDARLPLIGLFPVTSSVKAITPLAGVFSWKASRTTAKVNSPNFISFTTAPLRGRC